MKYNDVYKKIKQLKVEKQLIIYEGVGEKIFVERPSKKFKNYDINKNFQIFIDDGERIFRPNHLRVMIDLNLRIRSRPRLKKELLLAFDKIFYKEDPILAIKPLLDLKFKHFLNSLPVIATLSQLFLLEQEYNYIGESNYEPQTLFYHGWIRQFIDSNKELDNLCMSVCNRQPPATKYTALENKKHKKYIEKAKELWYLD